MQLNIKYIITLLLIFLISGCTNIDNNISSNETENSEMNIISSNETKNSEINSNKEDEELDFTNFIIDKLVNSLKNENYDNLVQVYIGMGYEEYENWQEMISDLLDNYKAKLDLETINYEYTDEIIIYEQTKDVNYYKYRLYDAYGNQHFVEVGIISNMVSIKDSMFDR